MNQILVILLLCAPAAASSQGGAAVTGSPQAAVDGLLAADRAFSAASANTDVIAGLSAMFANTVVMPGANGQFANGKAAAIDALRANADNAQSRIEPQVQAGRTYYIFVDGAGGASGDFALTVNPP